jgi:ketosteroid isomerase-like protein
MLLKGCCNRTNRKYAMVGLLLLVAFVPGSVAQVMAAELKPATRAAFSRYASALEARMQSDLKTGRPFLWVDTLDPAQRTAVLVRLRNGEVATAKLEERESGKKIEVPDGIVHHWIGNVFVPGVNIKQTLQLLQDYDHHKDLYKPEVVDSRLLNRNGDQFKAYLRFYKKKVVAVTLNTEHLADYVTINPKQAYSSSHTSRVAEVENAGEKNETEKPVGNDSGFLWALNSYWRMQEKDGGVYIQCEAISLTRDIPVLVKWIVQPFITEVPKESLYTTMNATRTGLLQRAKSH